MGRRGKRNEVVDGSNNGDVKEVIEGDVRGVIDEVSGEIRDILLELEVYQRTWIMPWFVQKFLYDLYIRLNLLLSKLEKSDE